MSLWAGTVQGGRDFETQITLTLLPGSLHWDECVVPLHFDKAGQFSCSSPPSTSEVLCWASALELDPTMMKAGGVLWVLLRLLLWPEPGTGESKGRALRGGGGRAGTFFAELHRGKAPSLSKQSLGHHTFPAPAESRKGCQRGDLGAKNKGSFLEKGLTQLGWEERDRAGFD